MTYTILVAHASNLFTDHLPWGDGLLAYQYVSRLAERGHRLHVAGQRFALAKPLHAGVQLHALVADDYLSPSGRMRYMIRLRRLHERLRRNGGVDLVHQLNPVDAGLTLALPSGSPLVLGPYVPDWPSEPRQEGAALAARPLADAARRTVRRAQQARAEVLLLASPASRAKVHVRGPHPRVEELRYGIEVGPFAAVARPGTAEPTLLFLASLSRRKGIFTLLDAFEGVVARVPTARLLVAGRGEDEAEVHRRVEQAPARPRIELLGHVERSMIPTVMARADVYCLPSYGEPFGLSALEAMASGLPVVGTDAGGLAHLVHPDGGLKVPPRDAAALAGALVTLLEDPERRSVMGTANRHRVEREYAWDPIVDRLERLYAAALAGGEGRRGLRPRSGRASRLNPAKRSTGRANKQ